MPDLDTALAHYPHELVTLERSVKSNIQAFLEQVLQGGRRGGGEGGGGGCVSALWVLVFVCARMYVHVPHLGARPHDF